MAAPRFALDLTPRWGGRAARRPLDIFAGQLYAAYGLRRLLSAYAGPCVRVRRAADGAEADIGFTATGALDTAALLAFAGAGSAFATVWYDQAGAARDASQPTGAAQPRLVTAGVLDVGPNGLPAAAFAGAHYMDVPSAAGFLRSIPVATYAVISRATAASGQAVIASSAGSSAVQARALLAYSPNATAPVLQVRTTDSSTLSSQPGAAVVSGAWTRLIGRARFAEGGIDIAVNGTTNTIALSPAQNTPDANSVIGVRIGAFTGGTLFLTGGISTVVLAQSSLDLAALDAALAQVMP
ncbi:arabinofuranosidase catalytic domain-containing protein [Ancylobacter sp.]|uniref:arabinofuranosidase catalytic domain-containing protein n=1 Tax=Ancylobacter sp. TaxID=1872567 RepID=UPI003D0F87E9